MCEISSSICSSPIGQLSIKYCSKGLHSICQLITSTNKLNSFDISQTIEIQSSVGKISMPKSCSIWLENYFHTPNELFEIPKLCPDVFSKNDSFQENVWKTLVENVQFGQTITYGQLAELSGNKKAARAVGTAMRRNPFQLIVPCHRVIRSNGDIGNYAGGERNNVKHWLLEHEKTMKF